MSMAPGTAFLPVPGLPKPLGCAHMVPAALDALLWINAQLFAQVSLQRSLRPKTHETASPASPSLASRFHHAPTSILFLPAFSTRIYWLPLCMLMCVQEPRPTLSVFTQKLSTLFSERGFLALLNLELDKQTKPSRKQVLGILAASLPMGLQDCTFQTFQYWFWGSNLCCLTSKTFYYWPVCLPRFINFHSSRRASGWYSINTF